jgi:hypothetical protein
MKTAPKIPEILKFPVSLDLFLRYTAGGKYKGDRLKKHRKFMAENVQFHRYMIEGRQQGKRLSASAPLPPARRPPTEAIKFRPSIQKMIHAE